MGPDAFQQFMSPYQQQVIDATMSQLDRDLQPKQSTKTILWISLMLQITMALLIIYDMTVGF